VKWSVVVLVAACLVLPACDAPSSPSPAVSPSGSAALQKPNGLPEGMSLRGKRIPGHVRYLDHAYSLADALANVDLTDPDPPMPAFLSPAGLASQTSRYQGMWAPVPGGTVYPAFAIDDTRSDEAIALRFTRRGTAGRYSVFYRYERAEP